MDSNEIMLQQYKVYIENKEKFVDRSFTTNKFYLLLVLVLIVTMFLTKEYSFVFGLSSTMIFSAVGMLICTFWWINIDSYNFLIKIKLSKVIEEIEKSLPVQPYSQEFLAIKEYKKNKREFMFADMQKVLATLMLLLFFVLFANDLLALVIS